MLLLFTQRVRKIRQWLPTSLRVTVTFSLLLTLAMSITAITTRYTLHTQCGLPVWALANRFVFVGLGTVTLV